MLTDPPRRRALFVACLCAEWCGSCRDYRALFEAQAGAPGDRYAWIDIEDHAEVVGDLEVETFPTLLIGNDAGQVLFFGSITPQARTLERLLTGARNGDLKPIDGADIVALAGRARAAL
ncbi:MAG: thioredoxin family protein [Pseudomonadota bacterium]|nr:thioredoxin family protein [Pseudomonadota bacterium]